MSAQTHSTKVKRYDDREELHLHNELKEFLYKHLDAFGVERPDIDCIARFMMHEISCEIKDAFAIRSIQQRLNQ